MGRPRSADIDEATDARLREAAARIFGEQGYESARLEDIARAAGIKRSSLLYHFASKDALYQAVVEDAFRELELAMLKAVAGTAHFETRLKRVIDAMIAFEREHHALLGVLTRSLFDHDPAGVALLERSFVPLVDRVEAFVRAGTREVSLRGFPVRAAILQLMMGHLMRAAMGTAGEALWRGEAHTWTLARALLRGSRRP
jgi:AcrR family transcriptional regulator